MQSMNLVVIGGNLTRDPELKASASGTSVLDFSVAVNWSTRQGDGTYKDEPSYIDCVAFGKTADHLAQNIGKGSRVHVAGRLRQRSWEGKDGQRRSKVEVVADRVDYDRGGRPPAIKPQQEVFDEDIPF